MFRKLVVLFAVGNAAVAQQMPPDPTPDASKILPYVAPEDYFDQSHDKTKSVTWPLGHGLVVALVYDLDGLVRNVLSEELPALGLTEEEAKRLAIENLETIARSGVIDQRRFIGPGGKLFVLWAGHWTAATCILLPGLREVGVKGVLDEELCVSIPHRETLLIFSKGDAKHRDSMLTMIQDQEMNGRKPLTFALFELTPSGVVEFNE